MRVVFVGGLRISVGGASITCWQLLKQLERTGNRIRAVAPMTPSTAAHAAELRRDNPEIPIRHYAMPDFFPDAGRLRETAVWNEANRQIATLVHQLACEEPIDVLVVGREPECLAIPEVAGRLRVPWVMRCGGYTLHLVQEGVLEPAFASALRGALPSAAATIVQANHMVPIAGASGCRNISVIPNAVDLALFSPRARPAAWCQKLRIGPDAPVVLFACNMKKVKRAEDVADSAAIVLRRYPDAVYVVAGEGLMRPELESRCQRLGVADHFRFLGRVEYESMPDLFALATAAVVPSAFEQQARVYLEGQAGGCVLIASDIAGAREVIEDGVTGLLFPLGDAQALAAATIRAFSDQDLRAAICARAREHVQAHSLNTIAERVSALLEDVIDHYGTSARMEE